MAPLLVLILRLLQGLALVVNMWSRTATYA
jgi:hypothetical protein